MIPIPFTREEITANLALIDAGVKALGLQAANAAAVLNNKFQAALASQVPAEVPKEPAPAKPERAHNGALLSNEQS